MPGLKTYISYSLWTIYTYISLRPINKQGRIYLLSEKTLPKFTYHLSSYICDRGFVGKLKVGLMIGSL